MKYVRAFMTLLARFFISAIFLASGVNKIFHWQEMEKQLLGNLSDWHSYLSFSEEGQALFALLMIWSPLLLIVATFLELLGSLLVLLGLYEKLGAILLILFLVPVTVLIHEFWFLEGAARELQISLFLRNMAIIGGLLMVALHFGKNQRSADKLSSVHLG